jgi:hypothetical protein
VLWYFESPANWLPADGVSLYNGSLEYQLLSVSWTGSFQTRAADFDIVLVSSKARLSLGNGTHRHFGGSVVIGCLYTPESHPEIQWTCIDVPRDALHA